MTHLNFEWGGDKYTWDLTKAGKCTLGYVIIFVTGYHFLHVVMGLLKDLTETKEEKAKKDSNDGKGEASKGTKEKSSKKKADAGNKKKDALPDDENPPKVDDKDKTNSNVSIEEKKKVQ